MTRSVRRVLPAWATVILRVALAWFAAGPAAAQPCRSSECTQFFPADAGGVNVQDFGAKGDGRTDDTAALLSAIAASGGDTGRQIWHDRLVYLPAGTYVVSGTLVKRYADGRFASGMSLIGSSVDKTIIRLTDHAPGFADPAHPRAVVMTTSKRIDTGGGRDYVGKGEGNDAYENFVENLTIDVGAGNPGAIGIDYLANNLGAVRDVLLRGRPGSGATAISMLRKWPGPALLQRIAIDGFDVGIDVANTEYGMTLSQIRLKGQRNVGLRNDGNALSTEALTIEDCAGTAVVNTSPRGLVVLVSATVSAGPGKALSNQGTLVLRDARITGAAAIPGGADGRVTGWLSGPDQWHPTESAWVLPHPQAPAIRVDPVERWTHVAAPPADDAQPEDATARLQGALRSGASTVYLPHGTYWISNALEIPATVHRILGMNATLRVLPQRQPGFARTSGMLRVAEPGPPLAISHLAFDNSGAGPQTAVEVSGARTVLLQDILGAGVTTLDRQAGGGPAFIEDTCCGLIKLAGRATVVARQLNSEGGGVRVLNQGAPLALIGLKTEGFCTTIQTEAGGRTEVLGGLLYVVGQPSGPDMPAFVVEDAQLAAAFVEESLVPSSHYRLYLSEQQAGRLQETAPSDMPARGFGHLVPLLKTMTNY